MELFLGMIRGGCQIVGIGRRLTHSSCLSFPKPLILQAHRIVAGSRHSDTLKSKRVRRQCVGARVLDDDLTSAPAESRSPSFPAPDKLIKAPRRVLCRTIAAADFRTFACTWLLRNHTEPIAAAIASVVSRSMPASTSVAQAPRKRLRPRHV